MRIRGASFFLLLFFGGTLTLTPIRHRYAEIRHPPLALSAPPLLPTYNFFGFSSSSFFSTRYFRRVYIDTSSSCIPSVNHTPSLHLRRCVQFSHHLPRSSIILAFFSRKCFHFRTHCSTQRANLSFDFFFFISLSHYLFRTNNPATDYDCFLAEKGQ